MWQISLTVMFDFLPVLTMKLVFIDTDSLWIHYEALVKNKKNLMESWMESFCLDFRVRVFAAEFIYYNLSLVCVFLIM